MPEQNMIVLGRLARPHSIRGEIRVDYFAESPLLLDEALWLRAGRQSPRPITILSWRLWKDQPVIRLEGVDDRGRAETLRGQELLIAAECLPEADPDEPYIRDILHLPVLLAASREPIGLLEDVLFPAGRELWSIRAPDGREILLPAVPDYVDDIDLEAGHILVSPPPGLLDIYLPAPS